MFGKSVKLFTLFGVPVRIDFSWLLIALLVAWPLAAGLGGAGSEVRADPREGDTSWPFRAETYITLD
jgi:hypothetical protein